MPNMARKPRGYWGNMKVNMAGSQEWGGEQIRKWAVNEEDWKGKWALRAGQCCCFIL